jgi:PAS domain S-box-containing protein
VLIQEGDERVPATEEAPAAPPSGAPVGPADTPSRTRRVSDAITMVGGLLCVAGGLTVMVAWFARATSVLRFGSQHSMAFNTALAVAVTGAALVAVARGRPRAALVAGGFDAALGAVLLAEYALDRGLGIDQLIVKAYVSGPHDIPGRPPITTAVCLMVIGSALLAWGPWRSRRRPTVPAAAGSIVGAIALTAIVGYATGTPAAYVWGHVTAMALLTAAAMLLLAISLVSAAWHDGRTRHDGLPRWLPWPAAAVTFGIAAAVWLAITSGGAGAGHNAVGNSTDAATILGFLMAGLVALTVWLAQQADQHRRMALTEATRAATAETAARESENRLFQFLDVMPVGVFIASPGGRPYYANHEAERMLGQGVVPDIDANKIAETYNVFVIGTDQLYPTESVPVVRAFLGQSSHIDDMEIRKPDDDVIPVEVWGRPVYGAGGEVDYGLAVFADASDRQARERTVADQAALLELAHDAILMRDQDSRITYWNAGAEHTYGYTRAEAVGRISHEILGTRFPEPLADIDRTMTAGDGRWEGELIHRCADGRSIVVESRRVGQRGPDGSILRFMEINHDITARKEAERAALRRADEIRALNATLERQVQQRTVHLQRANKNLAAYNYSIAHDLRTPLRAMSGFAEVLVEDYGDRLEDTGRGYAGRIQAASQHMARLIDDMLSLSQVSAAELNLQEVDLSAEATAICDQLRAGDRDRKVRVTIEDGIRVTADRDQLSTVLENLLQNAWRFTAGRDDATIEFATTPVDDAPICCYVRDNGAGFDFAYVDKLFQPFQKLHLASEFPGAGTGTGLASVQRIIERHGGRTWAEGSVNHGATFYFTLPVPWTRNNGRRRP